MTDDFAGRKPRKTPERSEVKSEIRRVKLDQLKPDAENANKGTERGLEMLEMSLRELGAGRSILIDKNGRIIAGNKTAERAASLGLEDVLIIPSNGKFLVAVQREDLDLTEDPEAKKLALLDNRISEIDLAWDAERLLNLANVYGEDVIDGVFNPEEWTKVTKIIEYNVPDKGDQEDPVLESEVLIEIRCSKRDLEDFAQTLDEWAERKTVNLTIT